MSNGGGLFVIKTCCSL